MLKPLWYLIPSKNCHFFLHSTLTSGGDLGWRIACPSVWWPLALGKQHQVLHAAAVLALGECATAGEEHTPASVGCPSPPAHIPWCRWESPHWLHWQLDAGGGTSRPGEVCCFCSFSCSCSTKVALMHVDPSLLPSAVLSGSLSTVLWVLWYHVSTNACLLEHPRSSAGIAFGDQEGSFPKIPKDSSEFHIFRGLTCGCWERKAFYLHCLGEVILKVL